MLSRTLAGLALVAALSPALVLAELPGDFDPLFNGGQPLLVDLARTVPIATFLDGVAFDDQGRLMVAGNATDATGRTAVAIARVSADGVLDTTFATNGSTVVQLGLGSGMFAPSSRATVIGPRPGGAGWLIGGSATASDDRGAMLAAAFDADGMLDIGYGNGGSVRPQPSDPTRTTIAEFGTVGPDRAVYVAGMLDTSTGANRQLAVAKVNAAGQPDGTFGNVAAQGSFVSTFSQAAGDTGSYGSGPLVTSAGLLVAGSTLDTLGRTQFLVIRLTATGALDSGFGGGTGFFRAQVADPLATPRDSQGRNLAVAPNGAIYVGGAAADGDGNFALTVTRLTPGGMLDGSFATGGTRRLQTGSGNDAFTVLEEILVQPDGKIVAVAASRRPSGGSNFEIVVVRLDTGGTLDPTFGQNGLVRLDIGDDTFVGRAALSPDARSVVIVGTTNTGAEGRGLVTRVLLEPYTPPTPPTTTTTTIPGGGCAPAPSLTGVQCRLNGIATMLAAAVPPGKLATRLGRALSRAAGRVSAGAAATGKAQRRKLTKGTALMRKVGRQLGSKAARAAIDAAARASLDAQVTSVIDELRGLGASA